MVVRIAINGFGRIGRMVLKACLENKKVQVVAINDLGDPKLLAHLLEYDSVQPLKVVKSASATAKSITVNGQKIAFYQERDPAALPWAEHKIDVVCESTGRFRTYDEAMQHVKAGAKRVLVSAPCKGHDKRVRTVVVGVNENTIKKSDKIFSNASCTTNSLAPLVKTLNDAFGIETGFFTTIHAYTSTQNIVDGPSKDWRRARAAAVNIIPTTTGAAIALEKVMPKMKGKLDGIAVRVPIPVGSITDLTVHVKKKTTVDKVNAAFKASSKKLKGIMNYSEEELVSSDIVGRADSVTFDSKLTRVNGSLVKISGWYDNEWGFSNRMVDLMAKLK